MEPNTELQNYLTQAGSKGESHGEGDFTLDPRRALEILREQGSIASHAPLFLLRAIYQHTGGATVKWRKDPFSSTYQLRWPSEFGPLPGEAMRIMAEGAFKTNHIQLSFKDDRALMKNMHSRVEMSLEDTFRLARSRLRHYPLEGLFEAAPSPAPWQQRDYEDGTLTLHLPESLGPSTCFVVDGIDFSEPEVLPLRITVRDNRLKCDLSLTRIPESDRKRQWIQRAESLLLEFLERTLIRDEPLQLDFDHLSDSLLTALEFLPFVEDLPVDSELWQFVQEKVLFRDVFGVYWSLREVRTMEKKHGSVLVIPAIPRHCPQKSTGEQPVLHWRGDTKHYGQLIFRRTRSGAGYLYSMARGEAVDRDGSSLLNIQEWDGGSLGLLPLGEPQARCEVQLVGKRRASETLYLEEPAPEKLRLLWRSGDELANWNPTPDFLKQVVLLVDGVLPELDLDADWIRRFLIWTGLDSLEGMSNLPDTNFLETVVGERVSPRKVTEFYGGEPVSVLEERSASLPEVMPFKLLLWDHPLLKQLGFETREESSAVRKAYWREDGRNRWLARYEPSSPQAWAESEGYELRVFEEGYLADTGADRPTRLVVWREGRPLGQTTLSESQFPRGYLLMKVDDQFPGDQYWSGPDREALSQLGPWLEAMKDRLV